MAYAELDASSGRIILQTFYTEKELMQAVPGSKWDTDNKHWYVSLTWASCITLRGVFGDGLKVGPALSDWSWKEHGQRIAPSMELRGLTTLDSLYETGRYDPTQRDKRLYPFQEAGREYLLAAGDALLTDEMGTGKTIQALAAIDSLGLDALPAAVICPNSVKTNWAREAAVWAPLATPYVIGGSATKRRDTFSDAELDPTALVIINFEAVRLHSRMSPYGSVAMKRCRWCATSGYVGVKESQCDVHPRELNKMGFRTVICDEAHRIKEPTAKQTRSSWAVAHGESVVRRWALTGTPLANHPGDMWSILHFLSREEFPAKTKFVDRYCMTSYASWGGQNVVGVHPSTSDELFKIIDPRFRRMPKALVLPQLPPKVRITHTVQMTPKQRKAYNELNNGLITRLESGEFIVAKNNLTATVRLMQLSSSYANIEKVDPDDSSTWKVTLVDPSPKIDALEEIIEDLKDDTGAHKPFVVAAESKQLINLASKRLQSKDIPHGLITGDQSQTERDQALAGLVSGKYRCILFTLKAGGTGLNMQTADTMIFLQRSWSMIENKQGEDRVHRIGSELHTSVTIIDVVCEDTIEEEQIERLKEKMMRLEEITRDKAALLAAGLDVSHLETEETAILKTTLDRD